MAGFPAHGLEQHMPALMSSYGRLPVTMTHASGAWLHDDQGRRYLDALSGIAVCSLGHGNAAISQAVADQAATLMHCSNLYHIPQQAALAERLCELSGMDSVFFCNSGAEANEACLKIARLHGHAKGIDTPTVLVTDTAFHGRTLATLSATGNHKIQHGFGPLVPGFHVVPYDDLDAIRSAATDRDDIVAILVEPIQGEGGINVPSDGYLGALRELCTQHDWLLMLDEIQSGMGRTGTWFAHQHHGIQPDVMSLAKALGNGMPIGACLARGAAASLIQPGSHGTTFGGNPLACQVGMTVIEQMEEHDLLARAAELGDRFQAGFRDALHNRPGVRQIRGKGLMIGIELERPCAELVEQALAAGLLINVAAGNVIRLLPPMILSDEQADMIIRGVSDLVIGFLAASSADQTGAAAAITDAPAGTAMAGRS